MNLNDPLKDFDDKAFEDGSTYRNSIVKVLASSLPGDEKLDGDKKFELFKLAMKVDEIAKRGDVDIAAEFGTAEIQTIKDRVATIYSPLVIGLIWTMLDPVGTKA